MAVWSSNFGISKEAKGQKGPVEKVPNMTMGGIPHYLDQVEGGKTAVQNIDEICFHPLGLLRTEFDNLYSSLFANPERYEAVVNALASTWKGLSRWGSGWICGVPL